MIVLVAGMHRSGTSMFARYLHHAGICMGQEFYVETVTNPYGHFEDLDFLQLQREELARIFAGEDYLVDKDFTPGEAFIEQSKRLLEEKKTHHGSKDWGWKDPRTTLFLDLWLSLIPDMQVVALVRSPRLVVNSLCARLRSYFSISKKNHYLKTYTHYNTKVLNFSRANPDRIKIISLERLIADPETTLNRLSKALGLSFSSATFRELFDAKVMSKVRKANLLFNGKALKEAEAVYRKLCDRCV